MTYSEQFDNAVWSKGALSVTANNAVSPDGYTNADLITADGTNTQHFVLQSQIASAKTISFFVKMGTQRFVQILTSASADALANYDLQTGAVGGLGSASTASMVDYGNGWWRLILTSTDAITGNPYLCYADSLVAGRFPSTTSTGTIWVWGAMAENGATYATSYIPTLAATVTRGADAAILNNSAALPTSYPFTMFVEFNYDRAIESQYPFSLIDSSTADTYINLGIGFTSNYEPSVTVRTPSTSVTVPANSTLTAGRHKLAVVVTSASIKIFSDGVLRNTGINSVAFSAGMNDLLIGQLRTVGDTGTRQKLTSQALIFKSALTDDQLAALTTL